MRQHTCSTLLEKKQRATPTENLCIKTYPTLCLHNLHYNTTAKNPRYAKVVSYNENYVKYPQSQRLKSKLKNSRNFILQDVYVWTQSIDKSDSEMESGNPRFVSLLFCLKTP